VHHAKRNSQIGPQILKKPQQRNRIGPARYSDADALAGHNHPVIANCVENVEMEFRFHDSAPASRDHSNFTPWHGHAHHPAVVPLASPPALTTADGGDVRD